MSVRFLTITIIIISGLYACDNAEKDIPPPEIFLQVPEGGYDIDKDTSLLIEPKITYDINSNYEWLYEETIIHDKKDYLFEKQPLGTYNYTFKVTTPHGEDAIDITVHSLIINSFEEYDELNNDGYNNNAPDGHFQFKIAQYSNDNETGQSSNWSGFAISKNTNRDNSSLDNEFSVYSTSGDDESKIFTVFKQSELIDHRIIFNDGKEHSIKSIDVNNSTYCYHAIINTFDKKQEKDFYLLKITGYDATGAETGTVDFYLADYRSSAIAEKYTVTSWRSVDLSSLGSVQSLGFKISSSLDDNTDLNIPKYFCLDDLKIKS